MFYFVYIFEEGGHMLRTNEDYQALHSNIHYIHDEDIDGHSYHVATLCKEFGLFLNLNSKDVHRLFIGGYLHDLGKSYFDQSLFSGVTTLSQVQREMIHYHPFRGFMLARNAVDDEKILEIILYHHERVDGHGYPYGLRGYDIPYLAKIVMICDAFDAMISNRGYKTQLSIEEAKIELDINKGSQFDFQLVESFLQFILQKGESFI